ncbi:hypothetical protein SF23_11115 [Streptomyces sp. MBRL 10]|nr:hypothetical protein SF23_11115 [Streptomyces sp. MBRL 10]
MSSCSAVRSSPLSARWVRNTSYAASANFSASPSASASTAGAASWRGCGTGACCECSSSGPIGGSTGVGSRPSTYCGL